MKFPQVDQKKLLHKNDALLELLATHYSVFVHVDTRKPGVIVPDKLKGQPQVAFQLGLDLKPTPVRHLRVEDEGWSATMTFNRRQFDCFVPWEAVWAIIGEETGIGAHWPADIPLEVKKKLEEKQAAARFPAKAGLAETAKPVTPARTLPPGWSVIEGGKKDEPGPHGPKAG